MLSLRGLTMSENELSLKFSRRDFFKAAGAALGAFAFEKKGIQPASAQEEIPPSVSRIFTTNSQEVNGMQYDQITLMATLKNGSRISAILNKTSEGGGNTPARFQLTKYDVSTGEFGHFQEIGNAPLHNCDVIALLPGQGEDNVTIVAGVNQGRAQLDDIGDTSVPRLFFSTNEDQSYDEIELIDQNRKKLSHGMVLDIKHIPDTKIALVQVVLPNRETGYGIFDPKARSYKPLVTDGRVPILDDIYMASDHTTLLGSGRVVEREGGFKKAVSIGNVEIDIAKNRVSKVETFYQNNRFPILSLSVQRDEDGTPLVGYASQYYAMNQENERHIYRIDMQPGGGIEKIDYGPFMDQRVWQEIEFDNIAPRESFVGAFPIVRDVTASKGGLWLTGSLRLPVPFGDHPLAAFIPEGIDPSKEMDKIWTNPFNGVRVFPAPIIQAQLVELPQNPLARNQVDSVPSHHAVLLNLTMCGQALILTNERYEPIGSEILYAIKSQGEVL